MLVAMNGCNAIVDESEDGLTLTGTLWTFMRLKINAAFKHENLTTLNQST
jgi:hypothetical protein